MMPLDIIFSFLVAAVDGVIIGIIFSKFLPSPRVRTYFMSSWILEITLTIVPFILWLVQVTQIQNFDLIPGFDNFSHHAGYFNPGLILFVFIGYCLKLVFCAIVCVMQRAPCSCDPRRPDRASSADTT